MSEQTRQITRFSVFQRIEHWLLFASFTTLALTGLPQKFALAGVSDFMIAFMGGIEVVRIIHRVAATIFLLESVYHLVVAGYKLFVLRMKATMLPGTSDVTEAIQAVLYNLGIRKEQPKAGRYNFAEKLEYWAMVWGLVMMGLTGFILWNPIVSTTVLPGEIIPAAKSAHGYEAVLAVLAILIWHFYSVHLRHWNWSMFNGKLTRTEMEEEHPLELEDIESGVAAVRPVPAEQKKRATVYIPVAAALGLALVFGVYKVITVEQTALTTIVPVDSGVAVYVRQTPTTIPTQPSTPTALPTATMAPGASLAPLTWNSGIGQLFAANCTGCHGSSGGLKLSDYADAMKGGQDGAVIKPGDSNNSLLVQKMSGSHPKTFSAGDLARIIAWIQAGAPEK
jgi:formate dehydrogenase gamma subunit